VADIQDLCPEAEIEVWAQDEARIGLIPILRRMWSPRGIRPIATGKRTYQWCYLYGFVHPESGRVQWLIMPTVSQDAFEKALEHFAMAVGASEKKRIILVVDGAGWHRSKGLKIPTGIHLCSLPPYSPELQPSERLWPLVRESVANKTIETLDELEDLLVKRCNFLDEDPQSIKSHTLYHWWPKLGSKIN
jgi:hypothetical protein